MFEMISLFIGFLTGLGVWAIGPIH